MKVTRAVFTFVGLHWITLSFKVLWMIWKTVT